MNCKRHPDKTAVTTCEVCGAGVCEECASRTARVGNMCVSCAKNELECLLDDNRVARGILIRGIIKLAIVWIIGFPLFIAGLAMVLKDSGNFAGILLIAIGILISGILTAIEFWRSITLKYKNDYQASYVIGKKIGNALIGLALGLILDPIKIIQNAVMLKKIAAEKVEMLQVQSDLSHMA